MVVCVCVKPCSLPVRSWVGGGEIGDREMIQSLHIAPSFFAHNFSLPFSIGSYES